MEKEYRISTGYKIFYGIMATALAGFAVLFWTSGATINSIGVGIAFTFFLLIFASFFAVTIVRKRIVISDDQIIVTDILGSKQTYLKDIKGLRYKDKGLVTLYLNDGRKINIYSSENFANSKDLKVWMDDNLKNLDREEYEAERDKILQNNDLGFTQKDRDLTLKRAGTYAVLFNIISLILLVVSFFFKETFYPYAVFVLLFPFIGLFIIATNKGLVKLYSKKSSAYPSVFIGMLFSGGALIFQGLNNDSLLHANKVWMPLLIGALVITVVITLLLKQVNDLKMQVFAAVLVSLVLSFGAVRQINKIFDKSAPAVFHVSVVRLYEYHKKGTTYHIVIDGWKDHTSEADITVSEDFYYEVAGHSKVNVNLKQGTLNIPWYYISL